MSTPQSLLTPLLTPLLVALPLALAGCGGGDSPEALANRQVGLMTELTGVLAKVKDKASAEQQKGAIEGVIRKMTELKKAVEALPADKQEPDAKLQAELEPKMRDAMMKLMQESARVGSNEETAGVIGPLLEKLPN